MSEINSTLARHQVGLRTPNYYVQFLPRIAFQKRVERGVLSNQRERSDSGHVNVRDDEDGHLIYVSGDVLQARCNFTFSCFMFHFQFSFLSNL